MSTIHRELRTLVSRLEDEKIEYALCGALALAVHGYPRATLDIDLLAFHGSLERILQCAHTLEFTLKAAPMRFVGGAVRIERVSKAVPGEVDLLMLDVLSLTPELEGDVTTETRVWDGMTLWVVDRRSLVALKMLRGNSQDLVDIEKLG